MARLTDAGTVLESMMQSEATPDTEATRRKRDKFASMSGVALTVSIAAFDATIISTILPRVAQALNGMTLYAWAGTGYFLACAVSILIFGRLGDLFGRKRLMLLSLVLVGLGSALSGLSQSMGQLIGFRVLQGVGGGMMIATAFAAPVDLFPDPKERVRWMVMLSVTFAVASGVGPVLGGAVTQSLGWRAAFFLIPLTAVFAMVLIWRFFPLLRPERRAPFKLDWMGSLLLAFAVGAPLVGLEFLTLGSAVVPTWVALLTIASSALAAYWLMRVEKMVDTPMFPLRVLEPKQMRYLNIAALLAGAVMFVLIYYIPLLLQDVFGFSPTRAGFVIVPLVAGIPIGSIINGRLFPRETNPQRLMVFGSVLLTLGCLAALTFTDQTSKTVLLVTMGLCGLGLGFLLPNFTLFSQIIADREDAGVASALVQTTRALGSAVGTAIVGMVIAELTIQSGLRIGLVATVIASVFIGILTSRVKMSSYTG
jgi:MFS family permease